MLNDKTMAVFKSHFKGSFKISLWFFAIYTAVMIVLSLLLFIMAKDGNYDFLSTISYSFFAASSIFLLVIGISTYSTFTSEFIYQGVTRRDYFKGMVLAVALLCITFTFIYLIISLIESAIHGYPFLDILGLSHFGLTVLFTLYMNYMLGLMIGITFYGFGVVRGLISILFASLLYNISGNIFSSGFLEMGWSIANANHANQPMMESLIILAIAAAVTIVNYFLNRNVKLKISTS